MAWPAGFGSNAIFAITSGATSGVAKEFVVSAGLAAMAALFRLVPVLTCEVLKAMGVVGKVTALPVYCWGFSIPKPKASLLLGCRMKRNWAVRSQVRPTL